MFPISYVISESFYKILFLFLPISSILTLFSCILLLQKNISLAVGAPDDSRHRHLHIMTIKIFLVNTKEVLQQLIVVTPKK